MTTFENFKIYQPPFIGWFYKYVVFGLTINKPINYEFFKTMKFNNKLFLFIPKTKWLNTFNQIEILYEIKNWHKKLNKHRM